MKRIITLIILISSIQVLAQDLSQYFPLKVGNVWVYECQAFGVNPPCYCVRKYRFAVIGSVIRNNKNYYQFQMTQTNISTYCSICYAPPLSEEMRIDSLTGNIFKYSASGCTYSPFEKLFDSLKARINDTVKYECGLSQWKYICRDTASQTVFGISRKTKGFSENQFEGGYGRTFAEGIGIIRAGSSGLFCSQNFSTLTGCVIDGMLYGDTSMLVGINQSSNEIPLSYSLSQNYPNPFNPTTNFAFRIAESGFVKLTVFDIVGKEVQTLVNQELSPGTYSVDFDGSNLPSGAYYYRLETNTFTETKKMVLIK